MHKFDLNHKTAVITGGAQGFGLDIAKKFLLSGAKVFIWDIDENELSKASKEINNQNLNHYVVDVSNFDQVQKAVTDITSKNKIDILINNAGITGPTAELWNYNIKDWNSIININLHGTFYCCKSIVPHMIKNNYGRIVNIASIAGKEGNPNASAYSAAKAGVIALTKSLGKELADYNISVNCVTPAAAKTKIFDQISEEHINYMLSKIPRKRFLKVDELASLVSWMVSEENSFTTGGVFDISGGRATY